MNVFCVPFVVNHSHTSLVPFPSGETRVVKEPRGDGKHRESQRNESCFDSHSLRVMSVVHQELVLRQERRFVQNGKQKVETREICLNLVSIERGQVR